MSTYTIRNLHCSRWHSCVTADVFGSADEAEQYGKNASIPGGGLAGQHWAVFHGQRLLRGRVHRDDVRAADKSRAFQR